VFAERFLAAGQTWTVTITGTEADGQAFSATRTVSSPHWIAFELPSGTYSYVVSTSSGQSFGPTGGSFTLGSAHPWTAPEAILSTPASLRTVVTF
jgi:hypothetical protein